MEVYYDEPESGRHTGVIRQSDPEDGLEIFFDDEPLEQILYGKRCRRPTRASIFQDTRNSVNRVKRFYTEGKMPDTMRAAFKLGNSDDPLSEKLSCELALILKEIVPDYPNPVIHVDLSLLVPLADRIWDFALTSSNPALQEMAGTPIYRCYEHTRLFDKARQVLGKLIAIARRKAQHASENLLVNNYAFEYLLEERWQEAVPLFEKAANRFKDCGDLFEWANARANYWTCRLETDREACIDACELELPAIEKHMAECRDWRLRKTLLLRAKIEEHRGRLTAAVNLVKKAIEAAKVPNTSYPDIDSAYLNCLIEKLGTSVG